jgi:integrase
VASSTARRSRGSIKPVAAGGYRVRVYAGYDRVSGKRFYLDETVPPGPRAFKEAERLRTRLLKQVDDKRNPNTRATVDQMLDRYLQVLDVEPTTRNTYEGYIRNHIRPALGSLSLAKLDAETIDSFYAQLRACRVRCGGRRRIDHRTASEHACDDRCQQHQCKPLAPATVRQIHAILQGAGTRAVRWKWISVNPADAAGPPAAPAPNPQPPTTEQAARMCAEAWKDPDWGMFVWLAMMTGARRGELCALSWDRLDPKTGILHIHTSIAQDNGRSWEKDTKTHQQRRITLDQATVELVSLYRARCEQRAAAVGIELRENARMFSRDPDGSTWPLPDTMSQRYERMCRRLGWDLNIKELRHYSATELIAAGVDLRTVAGRLGHSGGGVTTLRVYSAWRPEADDRAATTLGSRLPLPPAVKEPGTRHPTMPAELEEDASPYQRIANDLRGAIACGALAEGDPIPTLNALAMNYGVAVGTAQRAVALLASTGHVTVCSGHRSIVTRQPTHG